MHSGAISVTAIVLTHNESIHIERCLKSLISAGMNVCVVDSFSTDDTVEKALGLGANVKANSWVNYATQFQWALDNFEIETDWIMRVDADEYLSDELKKELHRRLSKFAPEVTGLTVKLDYVFLGSHVRHGGFQFLKLLRIWRRGCGEIEQRWMDEHITLRQGRVADLSGRLIHHDRRSISFWITKHNGYATREMIDYILSKHGRTKDNRILLSEKANPAGIRRRAKENLYNNSPLFFRVVVLFLYRYILLLGFLDGRSGFVYLALQCLFYRMIVDCKIFEASEYTSVHGFDAFRDYLHTQYGIAI